MGSKKKDAGLQVSVSSQELWEELLGARGLTVVEVYQGWCGPCRPVVSLFQKLRLQLGPDLLRFALAEADCLDVLEKYRGKCEPTFLFYAGGELVAVVRGADAPLLQKTILEQLEAEKKVLAGGAARKLIQDETVSDETGGSRCDKDGDGDKDVVSSEKNCTLAIIKPDAVVHGKADEIVMKIQEAGFDILTSEERTLTEAEMRLFYQPRAGEEAFEKLVYHMCSGPSHLLILAGPEGMEDVVTAWRNFMGPSDPQVARREQPESLRAQYGTEAPSNAVHGSQDREDAKRELALLFPCFHLPDNDATQVSSFGSGELGPGGLQLSLNGLAGQPHASSLEGSREKVRLQCPRRPLPQQEEALLLTAALSPAGSVSAEHPHCSLARVPSSPAGSVIPFLSNGQEPWGPLELPCRHGAWLSVNYLEKWVRLACS